MLNVTRKAAKCRVLARGGEAQSDFPSFAISSSQILVSSSISWFWKKSRPWGLPWWHRRGIKPGPICYQACLGRGSWLLHLPLQQLLCASRHCVGPWAHPSSSQSDPRAAEICSNPAPAHISASRQSLQCPFCQKNPNQHHKTQKNPKQTKKHPKTQTHETPSDQKSGGHLRHQQDAQGSKRSCWQGWQRGVGQVCYLLLQGSLQGLHLHLLDRKSVV